MARRRRGRPRSNRLTTWIDGLVQTTGINSGANTIQAYVIWQPTGEEDSGTLLRIVGSIATALQATPPELTPVYWGIYYRVTSSYSADPKEPSDVSTRVWLQWRPIIHFGADGAGTGYHWVDQAIDIKVKRKVHQGGQIVLAYNSGVAYSFNHNLRCLVLLG